MTNKKISRFEGRTYYKNQFGDLFQDDKKTESYFGHFGAKIPLSRF